MDLFELPEPIVDDFGEFFGFFELWGMSESVGEDAGCLSGKMCIEEFAHLVRQDMIFLSPDEQSGVGDILTHLRCKDEFFGWGLGIIIDVGDGF